MPPPTLAYFHHKRINGINDLSAESLSHPNVHNLQRGELFDVLAHSFDTDAHFVNYNVIGCGDDYPRINKPCLAHLRELGMDVVLPIITLDYDNPDHKPWTSESREQFLQLLQSLVDSDDPFGDYLGAFYTTRGGARLIYVCDEPLTPESYEAKYRWIVQHMRSKGLEGIDAATADWTRLMRLPRVLRDDEQQADAEWFLCQMWPERRLPVGWIEEVEHRISNKYAEVRQFEAPQPAEDEATTLLEWIKDGRVQQTDYRRQVKKALTGRLYFDAIFNNAALAEQGNRDNALHKAVSSVVGMLYGRLGTTPQHIYALFLPAVAHFEIDSGTPDWNAALWSMVCRIWSLEDAQQRAQEEASQNREQVLASTKQCMIEGASAWAENNSLDEGVNDESVLWIDRHMLASTASGTEIYVLDRNGRYFPLPVTKNTLIPKIRALLGDDVIPLYYFNREGRTVFFNAQDLLNAHATIIRRVELSPADEVGGIIVHTDEPTATLRLATYARSSRLIPTYSADVDEWLKQMFGTNYQDACRWIGWTLAFEEGPICALSIAGASGVGKTMFTEGLKEALDYPAASDSSELVGDWQYGLMQSPFVFIDEGWDEGFQKVRPSDAFRRLIGRSTLRANRKNLAPVDVTTDIRVVMTANDRALIRNLTTDREITPEARKALMMRLMHFDLNDAAAVWLRAKGGRRFTEGWIADARRKTEFTVAKHFLWIYERRQQYGAQQERLLVEGNMSQGVMDELRLHSGKMDLIIEAIVKILDKAEVQQEKWGIRVVGRNLFVRSAPIRDFVRAQLSERISTQRVADGLKGLITAEQIGTDGFVKPVTLEGDRKRWHQIDTTFLLSVAAEYGWPTNNLERLVEGEALQPEDQDVEAKPNIFQFPQAS